MTRPTPRHICIGAILPAAFFFVTSIVHSQDAPKPKLNPEAALGAPGATMLDEIVVEGRMESLVGTAQSATQGTVGQTELSRRPIARPGEVLETIPGLIITQHAGGGKANQYFLRGFNLDHGTDFSASLDGVPLNLSTHAHGQGYLDLNFLIPELIQGVDFVKGPYYAEFGNHSTVGAAKLRYFDELPQGLALATAGTDNYYRVVYANTFRLKTGARLTLGIEGVHDDGAWDTPLDYYRGNLVAKYAMGDASNGWSLSAMGYYGDWTSTDQVPQRAIDRGDITRFGTLDSSTGGDTYRYSLSGEWHRKDEHSATRASLYTYAYGLDLFSNFTGFFDQERGDGFEQFDRRWVAGFDLAHTRFHGLGSLRSETTLGLQTRSDTIRVGLYQTENRNRFYTVRTDDVWELSLSPWIENTTWWAPKFRTVAGLRGDYFHFDDSDSSLAANEGTKDAFMANPKLSLIFGPWANTELYLQAGTGMHSNDTRGVVSRIDPVSGDRVQAASPLTRSYGAEVGIRTEAVAGLRSTVSLWYLESDDETVFVGDAGTTEPSGRKGQRYGVELTNFYDVTPWLTIDADFALSRGRFADTRPEGQRIPDAIQATFAGGISLHEGGWQASVRARYFGPRDLIEDGSEKSASSFIVNAQVGYKWGDGWSVAAECLNLFDQHSKDQEYYYPSRLRGEPEGPDDGGYNDHHVHAAEPRQFRFTVSKTF